METEDKRTLRNITVAILLCQFILMLLGIWHKKVQMRVVDAEMRQEWRTRQYGRK